MYSKQWHRTQQLMAVCILVLLLHNSVWNLSYGEELVCVRSNQIYRNTQEVWISAEDRCIHYKIWTQAGEPGNKVIVCEKTQPEK